MLFPRGVKRECTKERISRLLLDNSARVYLNLEADFRLALARQEIAPTVLLDIAQRGAQIAKATA